MDSSRFHCFIGRGPFGCIFFGRTKIQFFFTFQVQGHSSSLCPQCLPDCELTTYTYTTSSVPFRFPQQKIILTSSDALSISMLHQTLRLEKFEPESLLWPWIQVLLAEVATHCDYQSSTKKSSFTTKSQTQSTRWCQLIVELESTHHTQQAYQVPWGGMCSYTSTMNPCIDFVCLIFIVFELFVMQYFGEHVLDFQGISWFHGWQWDIILSYRGNDQWSENSCH